MTLAVWTGAALDGGLGRSPHRNHGSLQVPAAQRRPQVEQHRPLLDQANHYARPHRVGQPDPRATPGELDGILEDVREAAAFSTIKDNRTSTWRSFPSRRQPGPLARYRCLRSSPSTTE